MLIAVQLSSDVRLRLDLLSLNLLNLPHKVHQLKPLLLFQQRYHPPEVGNLVLQVILLLHELFELRRSVVKLLSQIQSLLIQILDSCLQLVVSDSEMVLFLLKILPFRVANFFKHFNLLLAPLQLFRNHGVSRVQLYIFFLGALTFDYLEGLDITNFLLVV